MTKIDIRTALKPIYSATARWSEIEVPPLRYVMVDGSGDPNSAPAYKAAVEWLYSTSYALKFAAKALGQDYVVPPLEGLWWADDPADFIARRKERWHWTMMILAPDVITPDMFDAARTKAEGKLGDAPATLRLAALSEGQCLQMLHIGPYDDEGPALAQLHDVEMPARGLTFNGHHHEIYLGDPRRSAPEKLKTILRQPVRRA
ncbi:GyrI-like domain-containing protein [Devosia sediminis]|uniref:GyrI-like domain-containing protein n=1 Tax=Devosia sediminis TaxID=2798801 RepID=A0A934MN55_9HYPH|nr:GyrI-like domain-containing protein [Devosia sediminis]MBJ3786885.1 GyrI-like domain-containing protein [Devosia sediminis]